MSRTISWQAWNPEAFYSITCVSFLRQFHSNDIPTVDLGLLWRCKDCSEGSSKRFHDFKTEREDLLSAIPYCFITSGVSERQWGKKSTGLWEESEHSSCGGSDIFDTDFVHLCSCCMTLSWKLDYHHLLEISWACLWDLIMIGPITQRKKG